ncbi:MAG: PAS domain S-box protein [Ferruginibacter sp.]
MSVKNDEYYFLSGGGEMGTQIRATDWSKTPLGDPEFWPQSLRTMVGVMLDNPFAMYIAWGTEYTQLYNDGYRPILGTNKHPQALGISTRETFAEIWHIIGSMFDDVMLGKAVGFPDFMLPLNRNGYVEECYFDFSYSPIRNEEGNVGGVLVTVMETTQKKKAIDNLKESDKRFRNTVKQAPIGITILQGPEFIVEMANDAYLLVVDRKENEFVGKPLFESLPEVADTVGLLLNDVLKTGKPFLGIEYQIPVNRYGKQELGYFNFVYHPLKEDDGKINSIIVTVADVTESVKAKHALLESENQFRNLVMQSPIAMTVFRGTDFIIEMANAIMYKKIWRKTEDEMLGKKLLDVFPELKEQKYPEVLRNVYATGIAHEEIESPAYIQGNDGVKLFYFDYSYSPLLEPDGQVSGIMVSVYDVTEKVKTKKNIEESEKRFRSLTDTLPQLIWETDEKGAVLFANKRWQEYTGVNPDSEVAWRAVIHPDDFDNNTNTWMHSLSTGEIYRCDVRIRNKQGEYRWHAVIGEPVFDSDNKIIKWAGAFTDIHSEKTFATELSTKVKERTKELKLLNETLKKSEERYHLMVEEVEEYAILYLNREGKIENWNKGAEKIKGYKADEIIGNNFSIFYTEEDRKNNLPRVLLDKALVNGRAVQEGWRVKKGGEPFWASVVITAVHNEAKEVIGFSKVTHDLTEKKEADDRLKANALQLEQKNTELENMNTELQSFAYISSHDLQEPLRKIQTFSSQIIEKESQNLSDFGKDKFQRMHNAAKRMQKLIEDLLSYSRTSNAEKTFEKVNLKKIVDEVKEDLKEELQVKHAQIESDDMCTINIIPFQFRQLIYNLVSNSLKFSVAERPPHILIQSSMLLNTKLTHKNHVKEGDYCHISISDNGIGFEPQYSEKIFEVFQRLHNQSQFKGTGIGLAIVKKIVDNHHGIVTAKGELNKGATFDIYIPTSTAMDNGQLNN